MMCCTLPAQVNAHSRALGVRVGDAVLSVGDCMIDNEDKEEFGADRCITRVVHKKRGMKPALSHKDRDKQIKKVGRHTSPKFTEVHSIVAMQAIHTAAAKLH